MSETAHSESETNSFSQNPIGIFDSGLGGLSVLQEIRLLLPAESLIYIADSAHVPYGGQSPEFIVERSFRLAEFLLQKGAKALVIACNTATAAAAKALRLAFPDIPILGMEPAVKPAIAATKSGVVGVLATTGTIQSANYAALLGKFDGGGVKVVSQPAPGLVECVESGELDSTATRSKVAVFLQPLLEKHADVIVLGCTHYPFLRSVIQEIVGPHVQLIDTGAAVARYLECRLAESNLLKQEGPSSLEIFSTGDLIAAQAALETLWNNESVQIQACPV